MDKTVDSARARKRDQKTDTAHPLVEKQRKEDREREDPCYAETWEGEPPGGSHRECPAISDADKPKS